MIKTFTIKQSTVDYYVVEAESFDEALDLIGSGEIEVARTKYEDYDLVGVEENT